MLLISLVPSILSLIYKFSITPAKKDIPINPILKLSEYAINKELSYKKSIPFDCKSIWVYVKPNSNEDDQIS